MALTRDLSSQDAKALYEKYRRAVSEKSRKESDTRRSSARGSSERKDQVSRAQSKSAMPGYGFSLEDLGYSAPPGLGRTDIVRGKSNQNYPIYNPNKGDIGIKGSFDRRVIDNIVNDTREAVKNLGTQSAEVTAANNERDIRGVLSILNEYGIGTGPDAMANLKEERKMDPVIDYYDQALLDKRANNYNKMIEGALGASGSQSNKEILSDFGFGPNPNRPSLLDISKKYGASEKFGRRDYQAALEEGYTNNEILNYLNDNLNRLAPFNRPGGAGNSQTGSLYDQILKGNVDLSGAIDIVR